MRTLGLILAIVCAGCAAPPAPQPAAPRDKLPAAKTPLLDPSIPRSLDPSARIGRPLPNSDKLLVSWDPEEHALGRAEIPPSVWFSQLHADTPAHLRQLVARIRRQHPDAHIGAYISLTDVQKPQATESPPEFVPLAAFELIELLKWPGRERWTVRLDGPGADKLRIGIARRVAEWDVAFALDFVHGDNVRHRLSLSTAPPWAVTCDHLRRISTALRALGLRLEVNVAVVPGLLSDVDAELLAGVVDGLSIEQPLHSVVLAKRSRFEHQNAVYRGWLAAGKSLLLIAQPEWSRLTPPAGLSSTELGEWHQQQRDREERFAAAYALCIRESGDALFVAGRSWRSSALGTWQSWPAQLGPPRGPWILTTGDPPAFLYRVLTNGLAVCDLTARDGRVVLFKGDQR